MADSVDGNDQSASDDGWPDEEATRVTTGRNAVRRVFAALAAGAIGLALAVGAASPALADDPVDFGSSDIVDTAGVLGGDTQAVQDAIDQLQADTGQTLLVAYVNSFENPSDREQWVQEVRDANQLGASNVVLAVAVDDRVYQLSFSDESPLQADSEQIASDYVVPSLSQDDWAGAAIGATEGIRAASNGELGGGGSDGGTGSGSGSESGSGGSGAVLLWGFLVVGVIALVIVLVSVIRKRRRAGLARAQAAQDRAALEQRAGSLLVQLDDALKTSEQEVGFAAAEFGDEAVKPFTDALAAASASARQAFAVKQKLDDAFPESEAERAAMTAEVTSLAEQAIAGLDARSDEFDALRALDDNALPVLKTVTTDAEKLGGRLSATEARIAELHTRFEGETMSTLTGNAAQARQLLAFATETAAAAAATLSAPAPDSGHRPSVAIPVRAAQQSIGQAGQLLDAVDGVAQSLEAATATVAKEIDDVESDLAEARQTAVTTRLGEAALAAPIAAAEQVLAAARQASGSRTDPLAMVRRLQEAEAALDAALAPSREQRVQQERAVALLGRAQSTAQAQIQAASDFISTRRGAVGSDARQRLSEAQRLFDSSRAIGPGDPVQALDQAQRSQALAASAIQIAQTDVSGYDDDSWGGGGYGGGGGRGRSGGGDALTGAIIGGILGGLLT
ncbi:MAG: TPM domain-containing protein, partial [Leifsonia flava]